MSRFRRAHIGSTFFFTLVAWHRRPILCEPDVLRATREAIQKARARRPFTIDAWVQLPDHLHCIWTLPEGDSNFSQRWREIKHHVSYACRERSGSAARSSCMQRRGESAIWQRRFWEHQIRDERDFERHMDYVHINPVKHGQVAHASLWPYSSFGRYVREGVYPADWGGPAEMPDLWWE
ncbi:transposase [Massilia sp. Leaf139]|uniref:REP-associated tyrosine transposase n=1 Tax=Massilia sp. Leaf139 TaxID=1736272 RepID=UPI0006F9C277|nr:transposase [Massilia sp. Leaf139]KQQ87841.1 transposase [Massilia sp. Leaf139]